MRNFKNILTMVVGSLSILFYTQIGSATGYTLNNKAAVATEKAGSQLSTLDLSNKTMVFLLCDAGVATTGVQKCAIYIQVAAGVKGVISANKDSKIELSGVGNITGIEYGSSAATIVETSFGDTDVTTNDLIAPVASNPATAFTVADGVAITTNGAGDASTTTITSLAGDTCRSFNSGSTADLNFTGASSTYADPAGTILGTHLAGANNNVGIFLLQGFAHADELDRVTDLGYAETFTVPYTISVTSNTASTAQSCD